MNRPTPFPHAKNCPFNYGEFAMIKPVEFHGFKTAASALAP